jgi:hypothetical protein
MMDLEEFVAGHRLSNRLLPGRKAECRCGSPLPWDDRGAAHHMHLLEQAWYAGVRFGALAEADARLREES